MRVGSCFSGVGMFDYGLQPRRLLFQLVPSTPRTDEIESGLWPTPTARDWKDSGENSNLYRNDRQDTQLAIVVKRAASGVGTLSPMWVESVMGLPVGWTDINGRHTWDSHSTNGSRQE